MAKRYLIDTNIIIYFLDGQIPEKQRSKVATIFKKSFNVSTITRIEVLGWHKISGEEKGKILDFMNHSTTFFLDKQIQDQSIEIRQMKKINTPDVIIAATALINDFIVVTRNESDFKGITDLTIYNPFKDV